MAGFELSSQPKLLKYGAPCHPYVIVQSSFANKKINGDIFLIAYKGSAWAPAFAGAHDSGRAGQHFDNLRCSCPI